VYCNFIYILLLSLFNVEINANIWSENCVGTQNPLGALDVHIMDILKSTCILEVPITNHLRYYAPNLEKYKAMQFFMSRKIKIRMNVISSIILSPCIEITLKF
jgi:hypothetical protein